MLHLKKQYFSLVLINLMQNFAKLGLGSEGEHSISRMFSNAVIGSEYETRLSSEWYRV